MAVFSRFVAYTRKYPVVRGMISYGTIWPTSCLIQQTFQGKNYRDYDYMQALRFSIYGALFTAPTLFCWIKVSTFAFPGMNFKTAITKALVEQITYGPAAMVCFFFGMTLLEGRGLRAAAEEVNHKFFPSYKVGVCFWPVLQTINFTFIKERNRVPFTSCCSLLWTCFLAYMHQLEKKDLYTEEELEQQKLAENEL